MITISTYCTLLRIVLTPVVLFYLHAGQWMYAFFVFAVAAMTDFLDGFLARLWNQETKLGKILDPVADKILLTATFVMLAYTQLYNVVPVWFVWILVAKELILFFGGIVLYVATQSTLSPSVFAKWTTALQMIVVTWLMLQQAGYGLWVEIDQTVFACFAAACVYIVYDYGCKAYHNIVKKDL